MCIWSAMRNSLLPGGYQFWDTQCAFFPVLVHPHENADLWLFCLCELSLSLQWSVAPPVMVSLSHLPESVLNVPYFIHQRALALCCMLVPVCLWHAEHETTLHLLGQWVTSIRCFSKGRDQVMWSCLGLEGVSTGGSRSRSGGDQ